MGTVSLRGIEKSYGNTKVIHGVDLVFNAGRVEQIGAPLAPYERPANKFVAGFLGSPRMNFLPCEVVASEGNCERTATYQRVG